MKKCCSNKPVYTLNAGEKLCKNCFLNYFERKVRKTIREYKLIDKKDRILVACSGGKDSTTALYLLNKILGKRNKIEAIHIDVGIKGYSEKNLENLKEFCKKHKIKLNEFSLKKEFGCSVCYMIDALKAKKIKMNNCAVCGSLRRHLINKKARELKADKLVTGHNLDDEANSILMNLFKNNMKTMARLGPVTGAVKDKRFIPRVKPLYFVTERETELYSKLMGFPVKYGRCPCSENVFRRQISNMMDDFNKKHPGTSHSIVASFIELMPLLKQEYKGRIGTCRYCKEPSSKEVCDVCRIMKTIKT